MGKLLKTVVAVIAFGWALVTSADVNAETVLSQAPNGSVRAVTPLDVCAPSMPIRIELARGYAVSRVSQQQLDNIIQSVRQQALRGCPNLQNISITAHDSEGDRSLGTMSRNGGWRLEASSGTRANTTIEASMPPSMRQRVQVALNALGFNVGAADSVFGAATRRGIQQWQASQGYNADGVLSEQLLRQLLQQAERSNTVVKQTSEGRTAASRSPRIAAGSGVVLEANQTATSEALFDEFGIRLAFVAHPHPNPNGDPVRRVILKDVKPNSAAHQAGLRVGDIFVEYDVFPDPGFRRVYPERFTLDSVSEVFLKHLRLGNLGGFIHGRVVNVEQFVPSQRGGGQGRSFLFPREVVVNHIGFDLDQNLVVTTVIPGSPASLAGLKLGDRFEAGASVTANFGSNKVMEQFSREFRKGSSGTTLIDTRFRRGTQLVSLGFPPVPFGTPSSTSLLSSNEEAIFSNLPNDVSDFFKFVYLGDFELAEKFQMSLFDRQFGSTSVGLVAGAFGAVGPIREQYRATRGEGLFAQYILVKSNDIGVCDQPSTNLRVEQKRYQVWVNGYGVEVSPRFEVAPNLYEFSVPTAWENILRRDAPLGELAGWAPKFRAFVASAQGCRSNVLTQLETNMLSYLATP